MKRFISALAFCFSLLVLLSVFLFPPAEAKENVLLTLLNLPAPPPPNPLVSSISRSRDPKFYNKSKPPKDNAPIDELLDYWRNLHDNYRELGYNPKPSDRNAERIYAEIEKNHELLPQFLNILPEGERSGNLVKEIYDREGKDGVFDRNERSTIKKWLTYHTSFFSSDLARLAQQAGDVNEYVGNMNELLALTRVDFDRAKPIIDRLYDNSSQRVSPVLAKWALYRHALDTDSKNDIEQYRDELRAVVEDKSATPGMRDLALDALVKEKEWSGRDDWYYSLLGDETLADLRVNGQSYTGLTTILYYEPDERYIDKMLELVKSDNPAIRAAAVRNLVLKLNTDNPEIVRALIPWLENPEWANDISDARAMLVRQLSEYEIPESVPGLIKILDEKQSGPRYGANVMANTANSMAYAANTAVNAVAPAANRPAANYVSPYGSNVDYYPNRYPAIAALTKQKDARAIPALLRILPNGETHERSNVVKAILACNGFTITEQLEALETAAKGVRDEMDAEDSPVNTAAAYTANTSGYINTYSNEATNRQKRPITAAEIRALLGQQLLQSSEISDGLARALVDRIEALDTKDPRLAGAYRRMILKWQNAAINILLLRDLKRGIADTDTIIRLIGQRKTLRDQQPSDVFDIRTGKPTAIGIAACLLEDSTDYVTILENGDTETKTALLACARLIRAPLAVAKVAENLKSENDLLKTAAERYLESEDSPEARSIVLARYPGEAKILGARTAFVVEGGSERVSEYLWSVFQSLGDDSLYNGWYGSGNDSEIDATEKNLQDEVKKDPDLVGVYSYDRNYVRIYKNRVMFSWDEDDSRYRERPLSKYEFDEIKSYLTANNADELPPFISCGGGYCMAKELVMLGRNGGRRIYMTGGYDMFEGGRGFGFFTGLEKLFAGLKRSPTTLRYTLSRELPGLEIVLASDDLHAETVWKDGSDLRIAASASAVRKKVKEEIDETDEDSLEAPDYEVSEAKKATLREKRRYEGFSWYRVNNDGAVNESPQPPHVEFIPIRDGIMPQASDEQWKARTADTEIRTPTDGLFKVVRGKAIKLRSGHYEHAVVTPNGRFVIAAKFTEREGAFIVRVDLSTNREYPIALEGYGEWYPSAYIPVINKVLIARNDSYEYGPDEDDDIVPGDADPEGMKLVDPSTGATQPLAGEFRPLDQQTFRPLQKTAKPNEFWAAMPDSEKNETLVGIYDAKLFAFRPVLRVPRIKFNSMSMWVDDAAGKVYFVYRGHVLTLPLYN